MGLSWSERRRRWSNRRSARAVRSAPAATGFIAPPDPRTVGFFAKGKQLTGGNFQLAGHMVETRTPWSLRLPSRRFINALHGFAWLDHMAAAGDRDARLTAQRYVSQWIEAFGQGDGPGWEPDITGRRVLRWIVHGILLTTALDEAEEAAFFRALGQQTAFLLRRWETATPGLARFEAVAGLVFAALNLGGMERHADHAIRALSMCAGDDVSSDGALASRNPEELLEIFTLLVWSRDEIVACEQEVPAPITRAITQIAPVLRALMHSDGSLARFHGGGRAMEGSLERALATSGLPPQPMPHSAMGFARLDGARTSMIVDADVPPLGRFNRVAHASMLAFELTSNRRQLIVTCGSGRSFGAEWERACRATNSHSTLSIDGYSSARFGTNAKPDTDSVELQDGPSRVTLHRDETRDAAALLLSHDGYVETHGLTHVRELELSRDGRVLLGSDTLTALENSHLRKLSAMMEKTQGDGIAFALRFHLHPDADASLDMNGQAVSVALPSGEVWVFRFDGPADLPGRLSIEPSVYLEEGRIAPIPSEQIVVRATVTGESSQINWTLAKAQDTPLAIRDIGRDDELALPRDLTALD